MAKFKYLNVNPDNQKESDCVTRAISLASGLPYSVIRKKLYHTSKLLDCEKLCVCCYRHLLDEVFKFRRLNCDNMTVNDFANKHNPGIFLLRMNGHITCLIDGIIYDIWDCREEVVTDAWRVE